MKIRKTENHHMLLLPVLLILAAAFLATSLTGAFTSETDLTGHAVNAAVGNRCGWTGNTSQGFTSSGSAVAEVVCNAGSYAISGGCQSVDLGGNDTLRTTTPMFVPGQAKAIGWKCETDTSPSSGMNVEALCCRY
jgi:hypothetical protein